MVRGRLKTGCLGITAVGVRLVKPLMKIKNTGERVDFGGGEMGSVGP